ncbi:MAG: hypothetical protein ACREJB_11740, partial [Planctomycetaceae bacterium]
MILQCEFGKVDANRDTESASQENGLVSGTVAERKRLLTVTAANLRHNHIYITGHFDFFPKDAFGPPSRNSDGRRSSIKIYLEGIGETIETDIARDAKTGKPRHFFRGRQWVRRF